MSRDRMQPSHVTLLSLPLRTRGGAENCNITFFEGRGVKNVILQYSISREKCNITIFWYHDVPWEN